MPDQEEQIDPEELSEFYDPGAKEFDNDVDSEANLSSVIDAEFFEEKTPPTSPPIDHKDAIDAEVVEPSKKGTGDPELDALLADVPANVEVKIVVNRKPDLNLKFRIPNQIDGLIETRLWQRENINDIYSEIQRVHGGGRYRFQILVGAGGGRKGGFNRSWQKTLFDPAEVSDREKILLDEKAKRTEQERKTEPSPQFVNPQPQPELPDEEELIEKAFDRMERMANLFERFRGPQQPTETPGLSVKDQIILEAIRKAPNQDQLNADVVRKAMSLVDKEEKGWIDLLMYGLDHGDQLLGTIGKAMQMFGPLLLGRPLPSGTAMPLPGIPGQPSTLFNPPVQTQPAPQTGLKMPEQAQPPAPEPEKQPEGQQMPKTSLKKVEW